MTDKLEGIRPGDRVRVTFEGVYRGGSRFQLDDMTGDDTTTYFAPQEVAAPAFQIERIKPPLKVGDRVRIKDGGSGEVLGLQGGEAWLRTDQVNYTSIWTLTSLERIA